VKAERTHPFLIRIHEAHLHRAVALPIDSYVKALAGAVKRGVLTTEEAREIVDDANLFIAEGAALIGKDTA